MTSPQGRMFDELAKLMNDAAGVAQSARREVETAFRAQADRVVSEMDLVRREDLEVAEELARRAIAEVERLGRRLDEIESRLGSAPGGAEAASAAASSSASAIAPGSAAAAAPASATAAAPGSAAGDLPREGA